MTIRISFSEKILQGIEDFSHSISETKVLLSTNISKTIDGDAADLCEKIKNSDNSNKSHTDITQKAIKLMKSLSTLVDVVDDISLENVNELIVDKAIHLQSELSALVEILGSKTSSNQLKNKSVKIKHPINEEYNKVATEIIDEIVSAAEEYVIDSITSRGLTPLRSDKITKQTIKIAEPDVTDEKCKPDLEIIMAATEFVNDLVTLAEHTCTNLTGSQSPVEETDTQKQQLLNDQSSGSIYLENCELRLDEIILSNDVQNIHRTPKGDQIISTIQNQVMIEDNQYTLQGADSLELTKEDQSHKKMETELDTSNSKINKNSKESDISDCNKSKMGKKFLCT